MPDNFANQIDSRFVDYFQGRLKQVFLYVTDRCNLRCVQCLYKPNLTFQIGNPTIELEHALRLLTDLRTLGASKLSILGGEPSLYGAANNYSDLNELIKGSRQLGYEYIRIDTNGLFPKAFLDAPAIHAIDELAFSLDGYSAETHECLRGANTFNRTILNIQRAIEYGVAVTVTTCVHRALVRQDENGKYGIEKTIELAQSLGVREINFHVLLKHGFPMDTWTGETDIPWPTWIEIYDTLINTIRRTNTRISVRLPQHFVTQEEFNSNPEYYGYCPVKLAERVLVHPDGIIRICSGLISSKYGIARHYDRRVVWEESPLNELLDHELNRPTPCTNQSKGMRCDGMVPLCFSFKPRQDETVWTDLLDWESRRIG